MSDTCKAALNIRGQAFQCDQPQGHGMAHGSTEAGAIWSSDADQPIVGMSRSMDLDDLVKQRPPDRAVVDALKEEMYAGQSAAGESVESQTAVNDFPVVGKCKHCGVNLIRGRDNDLLHINTYSQSCRITRQAELEENPDADGRAVHKDGECYCTRCHNTLIHRLDQAYYNDAKAPSDWQTASNLESRISHQHSRIANLEAELLTSATNEADMEDRIAALEEKVSNIEWHIKALEESK